MARHGYIMETGSPQEAWDVAIKKVERSLLIFDLVVGIPMSP